MKYVVLIFLFYIVGLFDFLGSPALLLTFHYLLLVISAVSCLYYISVNPRSKVTCFLLLFGFIFPLIAAIKSNIIFGQPIIIGYASLRYGMFILFGFFLVIFKYDYLLLLKQINCINLVVAVLSIIAFYFFGLNHITIAPYLTSTNLIEIVSNVDTVKGAKLYVCSNMMIVSYIFYLLRFMKDPLNKANYIPLLLLIFYLVFVNKGRQPLAMVAICYIIYFIHMHDISIKKMLYAILPIVIIAILIYIDETIISKFTTVFEAEKTTDFSTLARINSIKKVIPYIADNPFTGFGNLSARFRNFGFQTFFGHQFYLADIGIVGTIARGGICLIAIYCGIYISIFKRIKLVANETIGEYMRYMVLGFIVMLVLLSHDVLYAENSILLALVFYPFFTTMDPNEFIDNSESQE